MMNRIVLSLAALTLSINCYSQQELSIDNGEKTAAVEHSVLVIPYIPTYYLSDADKEIAKATKKDIARIREEFHRNIEWQVAQEISKKSPCVSLLQKDSIKTYYDAAGEIFNVTGYAYEKPKMKPAEIITSAIENRSNVKTAIDPLTASTYLNDKTSEKFMNAVIVKKEVLKKMYERFGTDYFVFLTQLEFRTNYKTCLDITNQIYQREALLHFAVYDKDGKQIAGNYAISFFTSDENNAYDIMEKNFKQLAEGVAGSF
jgi:hypothetical protein